MQEYRDYNFTVEIDKISELLNTAIAAGLKPLIYINGMYYDIAPEENKA